MGKNKLEKYETQPILRFAFKKMCVAHCENYYDYDEIYAGIKNKNRNKYFNYFYAGPNKGKREEIKNKVKETKYYETHSISVFRFKKLCKERNLDYDFFERIDSGEKIVKTKQYYYKYTGIKIIRNIFKGKNLMSYYEFNSTVIYTFKKICKKKNWNYDFFERIDSGKRSGNNIKYFFKYTGEKVLKK